MSDEATNREWLEATAEPTGMAKVAEAIDFAINRSFARLIAPLEERLNRLERELADLLGRANAWALEEAAEEERAFVIVKGDG